MKRDTVLFLILFSALFISVSSFTIPISAQYDTASIEEQLKLAKEKLKEIRPDYTFSNLTQRVSAEASKGIYHSEWARINNMSIVKGEPTLFGRPVYLIGIIKNTGNDTQQQIKLVISLFDSNNNLIGVETGDTIFSILEAGDSTPYKIPTTTNISSLDHYLIQFDENGRSSTSHSSQTNQLDEIVKKLTRPVLSNASALGSDEGQITLVEFGDYQCQDCAKFHNETRSQIINDYVDTGQIKYLFKDYVINDQSLDKASMFAARASYCAADQGKYWQYHDELYNNSQDENTGWISRESLKQFAVNVAVPDLTKFAECLDSQKYNDVVIENDQLAQAIGLKSAPTFILVREGKEPLGIVGAQPYNVFQGAISQLEKN
jgi:protein-disulfide isomerase